MNQKRELQYGEDFFQALENSRRLVREQRVVNEQFILQEAPEGVRLFERLLSFHGYLANASRAYAANGGSAAFVRDVHSQVRRTYEDTQALLSMGLKVAKHAKHAGIVDDMLESWKDALRVRSPVRLSDIWADTLQFAGVQEALAELGVSEKVRAELTRHIKDFDAELFMQETRLALRNLRTNRVNVIAPRLAPHKARDVLNLLFGNRFDAVAEAFDRPDSVPVGLVTVRVEEEAPPRILDPYDVLLSAAIQAKEDLVSDLRQIEHTGLAHYQGNFLIALLLALTVLAVLIGVYASIKCAQDSDSDWCKLALLMFLVFLVLQIGSSCVAEPPGELCKDVGGFLETWSEAQGT